MVNGRGCLGFTPCAHMHPRVSIACSDVRIAAAHLRDAWGVRTTPPTELTAAARHTAAPAATATPAMVVTRPTTRTMAPKTPPRRVRARTYAAAKPSPPLCAPASDAPSLTTEQASSTTACPGFDTRPYARALARACTTSAASPGFRRARRVAAATAAIAAAVVAPDSFRGGTISPSGRDE
jgi:hypothetical protein